MLFVIFTLLSQPLWAALPTVSAAGKSGLSSNLMALDQSRAASIISTASASGAAISGASGASVSGVSGVSVTAKAAIKVPFFKSPQSQFPSGAISQESLMKSQISAKLTSQKLYKWQGKFYKLSDLKPVRPLHLSRYVIEPKTKQRMKVTEVSVGLAQLLHEKSRQVFSVRLDDVQSDVYDLGTAITLVDVFLKKSAQDSAAVLTTVPQGQSLVPISYENGFARVKYNAYVGYARLSELVTKFDLATMVFAQGSWHFVTRREFDWIKTNENKKIHMSEVRGMVTPDQRGIIASMNQKIPLWSQVEIVSEKKAEWIESVVKGHGSVWWKPVLENKEEIYTIDELLKKKIASVSFHPKNPLKGILSAQGVYKTEDGFHWKRLTQFEDFHGPVYYFNDILIFIGHFRSTDGGKSFDNYIQIERLASAIEYSLGFFPKKLQVMRIDTKPPFRLKIEVDTGNKKIKMESPLFAQDWKVIRS